MNIVVSGCSGFVGNRFMDLVKAHRKDIQIIGLDITEIRDGYVFPDHFYKIDPLNFKENLKQIRDNHQIDAFIHIGAYSNTLGVDAEYIYTLNYGISIAYLELATLLGIPFIWSSTAATYGDGSLGFDDNDSVEYLKSLKPLNLYAQSKNAFDIHVMENFKNCPSKVIGLKYFNVYGPYEFHKGKMMSCPLKFYHEASLLNKIFLFDSRYLKYPVTRNFVFVDDIADCTLKVLNANMPNGIYHLGSLTNHSFNDIGDYIVKIFNGKPTIEYIQPTEHLLNQYQYKTQADLTRLLQFVDFSPKSLFDGVVAYTCWLNNHRELTSQYMSQYDIMTLANP